MQIIYLTGDLNWLKNIVKNNQKLLNILSQQKIYLCVCVCVCVYKLYTFSTKTWSKIDLEAIKHNNKKWIYEKHLEEAVGYKNLTGDKTQYYSDNFKKNKV